MIFDLSCPHQIFRYEKMGRMLKNSVLQIQLKASHSATEHDRMREDLVARRPQSHIFQILPGVPPTLGL